jgi:bifunctional DNA-binding transcriptional regulator/antitoxin component of YhaV-PrlF toxin-antitoxin module
MTTVRLNSKRQATFPKSLCDELGVQPGDRLDLERRIIGGKPSWVIKPYRPYWSWIAAATPANPNVLHDLEAIRASIGRGRSSEDHARAN